MAVEAMDICLQVLKESNKSRFESYSVINRVLIISHITFQDVASTFFSNNLSRNSCILFVTYQTTGVAPKVPSEQRRIGCPVSDICPY